MNRGISEQFGALAKIDCEAATVVDRIDQLIESLKSQLKDAEASKTIFERNPDLSEVLNLMHRTGIY